MFVTVRILLAPRHARLKAGANSLVPTLPLSSEPAIQRPPVAEYLAVIVPVLTGVPCFLQVAPVATSEPGSDCTCVYSTALKDGKQVTYVKVSICESKGGTGFPIAGTKRKTKLIPSLAPEWNAEFDITIPFKPNYSLVFEVKRQNYGVTKILQVGNTRLGVVALPLSLLATQRKVDTELPILVVDNKRIETGRLAITINVEKAAEGAEVVKTDAAEHKDEEDGKDGEDKVAIPIAPLEELIKDLGVKDGDAAKPDEPSADAPKAAPEPVPETVMPQPDDAPEMGGGMDFPEEAVQEKEYPDGSKYTGQMKGVAKNGQGTYIMASGDKYEGEWQSNCMHGKGCFTWAKGGSYEGHYKQSSMHGVIANTAAWPQCQLQFHLTVALPTGDWTGGLQQGIGESQMNVGKKDQSTYIGEHKENKRDGFGLFTREDKFYRGVFEKNSCKKYKELTEEEFNDLSGKLREIDIAAQIAEVSA
eukprot:gene1121-55_t